MSGIISIRSDLRGTARDVKKMQGMVKKAVTSSINRSASAARTAGVRKVRERYEIKAKDVNSTFTFRKAGSDGMAAILKSKSQGGLPLIKFKTNPKIPMAPKQPRDGVKVSVLKGQKRTLKRAFVAKVGAGGHVGVFERSTTKRLPIKELFGPPIPYMLNNNEIREEMEQTFATTFRARFSHDLDRQLGRLVR
jgi:hypothetical protein